MRRVDERSYACKNGEVITVEVTSAGTVHLVTYNLDAEGSGSLPLGQPLVFPINKPQRTLRLLFAFSNNAGGRYDITLKGSDGGSDVDNVVQDFGIPSDQRRYDFFMSQ